MYSIENLFLGLSTVFSYPGIVYVTVGVLGGLIVGALPGFTSTMGIAVLLPLTFGLDAVNGFLALIGIYVGGIAGGSIPAVALNIPGTPASAATTFDGYHLTKNGRAGEAITLGLLGSTIGGLVGGLLLLFLAPQIARIALRFGPPEYFAMGILGLTIVVSISSDHLLKGVIVAVVGLIISFIGMDPVTSVNRFTFGNVNLRAGISYVPLLIGLFGISEVFIALENNSSNQQGRIKQEIGRLFIKLKDIKKVVFTGIKSGLLGAGIGSLPGAGADIASFAAYEVSKRTISDEFFGEGDIRGIVASEAGNNGNCGGALIPMLTFGIPGDAQSALLLAALMMHGLSPGPALFTDEPQFIWPLIIGFLFATILKFVIGLSLSKYIVTIINQPKYLLYPSVTVLSIIGAFAIQNRFFDILIAIIFGLTGYFMKKYNYPLAPLVLALILAPMIESELRRALIISGGDFLTFFTRPLFLGIVALIILSFSSLLWLQKKTN